MVENSINIRITSDDLVSAVNESVKNEVAELLKDKTIHDEIVDEVARRLMNDTSLHLASLIEDDVDKVLCKYAVKIVNKDPTLKGQWEKYMKDNNISASWNLKPDDHLAMLIKQFVLARIDTKLDETVREIVNKIRIDIQ